MFTCIQSPDPCLNLQTLVHSKGLPSTFLSRVQGLWMLPLLQQGGRAVKGLMCHPHCTVPTMTSSSPTLRSTSRILAGPSETSTNLCWRNHLPLSMVSNYMRHVGWAGICPHSLVHRSILGISQIFPCFQEPVQTDFPCLACCNQFCQEQIRNLHVFFYCYLLFSQNKENNDLKIPCIDTKVNTKMAEAQRKACWRSTHNVRLETMRGGGLLHVEFL